MCVCVCVCVCVPLGPLVPLASLPSCLLTTLSRSLSLLFSLSPSHLSLSSPGRLHPSAARSLSLSLLWRLPLLSNSCSLTLSWRLFLPPTCLPRSPFPPRCGLELLSSHYSSYRFLYIPLSVV